MTNRQRNLWLLTLFPLLLTACGGGGGGGGSPAVTASLNPAVNLSISNSVNQIPVTVEQYSAINYATVNLPYVTVKVCHPTSGHCLTIDHVIVDTGSYGLRILSSFPGVSTLGLPTVTTTTSQPVAECVQFLGGAMWGGVYQAKITLAQEVTSPIPIQLVGDPAVGQAPSGCTSVSNNIGTQSGMGGNGLLGVGTSLYDMSPYYSCTGSGVNLNCTAISAPTPQTLEVMNPVAAFTSTDIKGIILQMPAVGPHGTVSATGILTFGIDSRTDNQLTPLGLNPVVTDPTTGNFSATLTGQTTYSGSYFDSGSSFYYIPLSNIATDSNGDFTPPSPVTLTGTAGGVPISFNVMDITADLNAGNLAFNDGGNNGGGLAPGVAPSADFGLPYYFGHSIAHVMAGQTVTEGTGPFYAIK